MTLEIVIPQADTKDKTTKDLAFSILAESEPKTLTQLHREIKRKYNFSVSFQAVIKAVQTLHSQNVLVKEGKMYALNKEWIFEARKFFDNLYMLHYHVKKPMRKVELSKEVTVYTLNNLLELDRLWNDLLTTWARKHGTDRRNVWRGSHCWWLLPRIQDEDLLHDLFAKKGIKTYNILTENSKLDKVAIRYYTKKEEKIKYSAHKKENGHLSAYGDFILKFELPKSISIPLDEIYAKTKDIEDIDMKKIIDLFKSNAEIEVTVIRDAMLANAVKGEIINDFKS